MFSHQNYQKTARERKRREREEVPAYNLTTPNLKFPNPTLQLLHTSPNPTLTPHPQLPQLIAQPLQLLAPTRPPKHRVHLAHHIHTRGFPGERAPEYGVDVGVEEAGGWADFA